MAPIHGVPTTLCERKPLRVHQLGNLTRVAAPLTRGRLLHQGDIASWRNDRLRGVGRIKAMPRTWDLLEGMCGHRFHW